MRLAIGSLVALLFSLSQAGAQDQKDLDVQTATAPQTAQSAPQAAVKAGLARAYELAAAHKTQQAIVQFKNVLALDPENRTALTELGYASARKKNWPEAVKYLKSAVSQDPDNMRLHMELGYARQSINDFKGAAGEFEIVSKEPGEFQEQAKTALKTVLAQSEPGRSGAGEDPALTHGHAA